MKKRNIGTLVLLGTLLFVFGVAQAQNNGGGEKPLKMTDEKKAAKKEEIQAKAENRWQTVTCQKVQTRMQAKSQNYGEKKSFHQQNYEKMKTKINEIIAGYETKGADVSKLKEDMVLLEKKLSQLYADHDALIMKMTESAEGACASATKESLGEKIREIQQYRLATIKVDIQDIRSFYSKTLRPDLVALIQAVNGTVQPTATVSPIN